MKIPAWLKSKPVIYGGLAIVGLIAVGAIAKRSRGSSAEAPADDGAALTGPAVLFAGGPSLAAPGAGNWDSTLPPSSGEQGTDWALAIAGSQALSELASQALTSMAGKAGWRFEGSFSPDGSGGISLNAEVERGGFGFRDYLLGWEHDNSAPVSGGPSIDTSPVPNVVAVDPPSPITITATNPTSQPTAYYDPAPTWIDTAKDVAKGAQPTAPSTPWTQKVVSLVKSALHPVTPSFEPPGP